jgi:hypothetical protein
MFELQIAAMKVCIESKGTECSSAFDRPHRSSTHVVFVQVANSLPSNFFTVGPAAIGTNDKTKVFVRDFSF